MAFWAVRPASLPVLCLTRTSTSWSSEALQWYTRGAAAGSGPWTDILDADETERQRDRETERQRDRQTDRQTDRQAGRQTDTT